MLIKIHSAMLVERRPDSPRSPMPALHCQSSFSGSSCQGESTSGKMELESPGASHSYGHRMLEPESRPCSPHAHVSRVIPETHTCVGAASCKRLHLSHPELCKKIVEKARRAFSKLGKMPGSKTFHNSNSARDAGVRSNNSPSSI